MSLMVLKMRKESIEEKVKVPTTARGKQRPYTGLSRTSVFF